VWRFVWYEDSGPTLFVTRLQQVEHQAYAMLLSQRAGVSVPGVVAATTAGPTAVLVERRSKGVVASDLSSAGLTDDVLAAAWRAVAALRRARVAHGALDLTKLVVTDEGLVEVVDFEKASTSATDAQLDADAARFIAATSVVVGPDRAVAACAALGTRELVAALPYLQPPVLTDPVRHAFRHRRGALAELRATAAAKVHADLPPLVQLERVRPRSVALALLTFVGAYALLGQIGSPGQLAREVSRASWGWVLVALLLAAATNVGYAMAYAGSTTVRLPFGRTVELQVAGSFTNLVAPNGLGTAAINARFLQVRGVPLRSALASVFVSTVGSAVAEVGLFLTALPIAGSSLSLGRIPWRSVLAGGMAGGLIAIIAGAVTWRAPRIRGFIAEHGRAVLETLRGVVRSPAKLSLVVGGQLLVQLLYAATLSAACLAFGATVPLTTLLLVNVGSSALSGLVPAPGGLGVAEATLSGALAATGMPPATAISIALTYRLVTTWLPWAPGWIALHALQRGDDL
ncbi:MAG: glycosyltransferase 2 family protein, partial [Acidimicrobiaceae bacterium]